MVRLVYHTPFGAINLEYDQPLISVGSAPNNDLVLKHPSVRAYHARVELLDDRLRVHPALGEGEINPDTALQFGQGEQFLLGEVLLEVQRGANTVAVPLQALLPEPMPQDDPNAPFFCEHCQRHRHASEITRIGIQGKPKHLLCPKCSHPVILVGGELPRESVVRRITRGLRRLFQSGG